MNFNTQDKKINCTQKVRLHKEKRQSFVAKLKDAEVSYTYNEGDGMICIEVNSGNADFVNNLIQKYIGDF
jgi:arginine repressor